MQRSGAARELEVEVPDRGRIEGEAAFGARRRSAGSVNVDELECQVHGRGRSAQGDPHGQPAAAGVRQPEWRRHGLDKRLQSGELAQVATRHLDDELALLADEVVGAAQRNPLRRRRELDILELEPPVDQIQHRGAGDRNGPFELRRHGAQGESRRARSPPGVVQGELVAHVAVSRSREGRSGKLEILEHRLKTRTIGLQREERERTGPVESDLESAGDRTASVDRPFEVEA